MLGRGALETTSRTKERNLAENKTMRSLPPSVASSQPLSIPSISKSSPYLKPPSGLPPPPSLRPELSHSHLLGAGYPVTSSGTKMAAMAAAAEAAKRSVTPVSSSIPLPMHLSPFAAGNKIQSLFALPFFKIYSAKFLFMFTIQWLIHKTNGRINQRNQLNNETLCSWTCFKDP